MSLSTDRAALALAVSTVAEIEGYELPPKVIRVGDAWPQLGPISRGDDGYLLVEWQVVVVLSAEPAQLVERMDALADQLVEAMRPVLFVESITPVAVPTSAGSDLVAVEIRGRKEL